MEASCQGQLFIRVLIFNFRLLHYYCNFVLGWRGYVGGSLRDIKAMLSTLAQVFRKKERARFEVFQDYVKKPFKNINEFEAYCKRFDTEKALNHSLVCLIIGFDCLKKKNHK